MSRNAEMKRPYTYSECVAIRDNTVKLSKIIERIRAEESSLITIPSANPDYDQGFRCALQTIEFSLIAMSISPADDDFVARVANAVLAFRNSPALKGEEGK